MAAGVQLGEGAIWQEDSAQSSPMVRPVLTMFRAQRMTMAAARASRPATCERPSAAAIHAIHRTEAVHRGEGLPEAARTCNLAIRRAAPEVGSSMNTMEGLATSSTAIVSRFLASTERPLTPGRPTSALLNGSSSTSSITCQPARVLSCHRPADRALRMQAVGNAGAAHLLDKLVERVCVHALKPELRGEHQALPHRHLPQNSNPVTSPRGQSPAGVSSIFLQKVGYSESWESLYLGAVNIRLLAVPACNRRLRYRTGSHLAFITASAS